ncbi:MAG: hypothetical protein RBQ71_02610 [Acholeplasmataceae bacterium]|jgi:hypothetical protein|nr:hypothetical protein [Acholeplasmataceae bacterium]
MENKRIFINREQIKDEFRRANDEMRQRRHECIENEVKLFTDRDQMVTYVNQLTGIENVDIYKIEDNLYKVLVSRKKHREGCQHHHHE